jgi:hypothetical protein
MAPFAHIGPVVGAAAVPSAPDDALDAAWHHAYSEECRLFSLFRSFTEQDTVEYRSIAMWLNDTGLALSDLTTAELVEIFLQKNSK